MNDETLSRRLDRVESDLGSIKNKVTLIETKNAVDEVHRTNVERRLASIEGGVSKLNWLIISSLIIAAVGFALSGGLVGG